MRHPEDLLSGVMSGDRKAFDALYAEYKDAAYGTAWNIVRSGADADDVVQETFLTVYRNIGSLRDTKSFPGWFFRILVNAARMKLRKRGLDRKAKAVLEKRITPPSTGKSRHEETPDRVFELVDQFTEALSDEDREVFSLGLMERLSYAEISEATGLTLESVRSRVYRVRKRFKEFWERNHAVHTG
jgi:RNA polymerase sigma-70 factor (ECF subfamily)